MTEHAVAETEPAKHREVRNDLVPRFEADDIKTFAALDVAIAERHARRVRRSWEV